MILRVIVVLVAFLCAHPLSAQLFTIGPDSVAVAGTSDTLFLEAHTTLVNTQDTAINVAWRREIIVQPDEWINYLCSDFLCFLPENDFGNIYVLPHQEMDVNMTFFPQGVPGVGEVVVTFWDTTDVEGSAVQIKYTCEAMSTTSVRGVDEPALTLYPNPASIRLHIESPELIERVQILDAHGRLLRTARQIPVSLFGLSPGHYYLRIRFTQGGMVMKRFTKS